MSLEAAQRYKDIFDAYASMVSEFKEKVETLIQNPFFDDAEDYHRRSFFRPEINFLEKATADKLQQFVSTFSSSFSENQAA